MKVENRGADWIFKWTMLVGALVKRSLADMASALQVPVNARGLAESKHRSRSRLNTCSWHLLCALRRVDLSAFEVWSECTES